MASYVLSNANRSYVALETVYGAPAIVDEANRFALFSFDCHQSLVLSKRRDKTGARTYRGSASSATRASSFDLVAHLTSWNQSGAPGCGPLVQAACGAPPVLTQGVVIVSVDGAQIGTRSPSGLAVGSAISNGSEIRFITAVGESSTFTMNAPFLTPPAPGATLGATMLYGLGTELPSVCLYDYWGPVSTASRILTGAGVDKFVVDVKGDLHELSFSGPAADVIDSVSGDFALSGLISFPAEPALSPFEYSIVDGELGQVWLGSPLNQVFALTQASLEINNNLSVRSEEFGYAYPRALVPGPREVVSTFTLFAQPDSATQALYVAAKNRTPIEALLQLGSQSGQMMAIYLPNMTPEMPLFADPEPFLLWEFKNNLAQGVVNDETYIAFG